jgi:putative flippase GtrA
MFWQYARFFVNGGILGVAAWWLQLTIYRVLHQGEGDSQLIYAVASALTYLPLVLVNFAIQRKFVFSRHGVFWRFVVANLFVMLLVSAMSPICQVVVDLMAGKPWGARIGFALAALLGSVPSFLIKRKWVFGLSFGRAGS